MTPYQVEPLIAEADIVRRVAELAAEINAFFEGTEKLVVVGLLRGSFIFIADLARRLRVPVEIDFIEASSYGNATESSREVRILKDLRGEIEGRDVLVVEDIVDTGHTLAHVLAILATRKPRRLEVCALLSKPSRREVGHPLGDLGLRDQRLDPVRRHTVSSHRASADAISLPKPLTH